MDDIVKEITETVEKFNKGTYINKDDFKELVFNHIANMSIEIKERRLGSNQESMVVRIVIDKS